MKHIIYFVFVLGILFLSPWCGFTQSLQGAKVLVLPFENQNQHSFFTPNSQMIHTHLNQLFAQSETFTLMDPGLFAEILLQTLENRTQDGRLIQELLRHPSLNANQYDYILYGKFEKIEQFYQASIIFFDIIEEQIDPRFSFLIRGIPQDAFPALMQHIDLELLAFIGHDYRNEEFPELKLELQRIANMYEIGNIQSYYNTLSDYQALLKKYENHPEIMAGMAKSAARLGQEWRMWDREKSEHFLNVTYSYAYNSLAQDETQLNAHLALVMFYRIRSIPQKLVDHLLLAESLAPDDFETLLLAGETYQGLYGQAGSNPQKSLSYLNRCISRNRNSLPARMALSGTLRKLGRYEDARALIEQLIQEYPHEALLYNNLGGLEYELNNLCQAETFYKQGLQLDPNNVFIIYNLAVTLTNNNKPAQAQSHWQVLQNHPAATQRMQQIAQAQCTQASTEPPDDSTQP